MNGQVLNGTAITDTSLVDLCAFMNAASISNIPILLSAQSAGALVKAMTTSAPVQPVAVPDGPDAYDYVCEMVKKEKKRRADRGAEISKDGPACSEISWLFDRLETLEAAAPAAQGIALPAERLACPACGEDIDLPAIAAKAAS